MLSRMLEHHPNRLVASREDAPTAALASAELNTRNGTVAPGQSGRHLLARCSRDNIVEQYAEGNRGNSD